MTTNPLATARGTTVLRWLRIFSGIAAVAAFVGAGAARQALVLGSRAYVYWTAAALLVYALTLLFPELRTKPEPARWSGAPANDVEPASPRRIVL
ncbi:MAG TPA: hypothetical protein VIM73_08905 [Polyangiaceae bacterium]